MWMDSHNCVAPLLFHQVTLHLKKETLFFSLSLDVFLMSLLFLIRRYSLSLHVAPQLNEFLQMLNGKQKAQKKQLDVKYDSLFWKPVHILTFSVSNHWCDIFPREGISQWWGHVAGNGGADPAPASWWLSPACVRPVCVSGSTDSFAQISHF